MSIDAPEIVYTTVPSMLIASVRFHGRLADVPARLASLRAQAGPCIVGHGFCLVYSGSADSGNGIEVAYPVSGQVDAGAISTREYPGVELIGIVHRGSYDNIRDSWRKLFSYVADNDIGLAHGPSHQVYLEGQEEHGDQVSAYVTELQEPLLMPLWMNRLAEGLDQEASREVREQVMAGRRELAPASTPRQKSDWAKGAMERLDALVAEPETRHCIMSGCAHVFPQARIDQLRARYQELGDIEALLAEMGGDRSDSGRSYYAAPHREGNIIYTTKTPWDAGGFEAETDPAIKRSRYCHCALVREAIRSGEAISGTYCYCGTGWFSRLWEGILGHPVRVELVRSVLQEDNDCTFAIHLEDGP